MSDMSGNYQRILRIGAGVPMPEAPRRASAPKRTLIAVSSFALRAMLVLTLAVAISLGQLVGHP